MSLSFHYFRCNSALTASEKFFSVTEISKWLVTFCWPKDNFCFCFREKSDRNKTPILSNKLLERWASFAFFWSTSHDDTANSNLIKMEWEILRATKLIEDEWKIRELNWNRQWKTSAIIEIDWAHRIEWKCSRFILSVSFIVSSDVGIRWHMCTTICSGIIIWRCCCSCDHENTISITKNKRWKP